MEPREHVLQVKRACNMPLESISQCTTFSVIWILLSFDSHGMHASSPQISTLVHTSSLLGVSYVDSDRAVIGGWCSAGMQHLVFGTLI
jgi:hypothetical protein